MACLTGEIGKISGGKISMTAKLCEARVMTAKPAPTPEGKLIQSAAKRAGISARQAAPKAQISEGRWRQITNGYQVVTKGLYSPVRDAPAETVAAMARVVGVTPEELEEAGRPDAATILQQMGPYPEDPVPPQAEPESLWDKEILGESPLEEDEELRWRDDAGGWGRLYEFRVAGFAHKARLEPMPLEDVVPLLRDQLAKRVYRVTGMLMDRNRGHSAT